MLTEHLIMADSMLLDKSLSRGSDNIPEIYCDPCYDVERKILPAAGFCQDCFENLCPDCISAHKKQKSSRNHRLLDKTRAPHKKPLSQGKTHVTVKCHQHEGDVMRSYCRSCDQLCCKICQTIDHQVCNMQRLTNASASIKDSQQLKDLEKKLGILKKRYNENLSKADNQSINIEKLYMDAIKDMRKLQEKFEKLLAETKIKAEAVKDVDLKNMETISTTCNLLVEQIIKISSNLDEKQGNKENETIFISIKRAESQLKSFEDRLIKLETENTIQQYVFEPEKKLNAMLDELNSLGQLSFSNRKCSAPTPKNSTSFASMLKAPVFIKDIDTKFTYLRGSIMLPNQRLLLTDCDKIVKLMDTKKSTTVSELQLPYGLVDATQVKNYEVAITCHSAKKIQFVSVSSDKLSKGSEMSVDGECRGIEYNDQDDTLIVQHIPTLLKLKY